MQRSAGVTVIAVFALLGSLLCFLMAGLMVVARIIGLPQPTGDEAVQAAAKLGMTMAIVVFLVPTIWGGATSIGLFRVKPWARISTLIFASLLAVLGAATPIFLLIIPMPTTPGADPAMMATVKIFFVGFYLALAAIGVWWLIYLTRPKVRAQFETAGAPTQPSRRPLSVTIIAWFLIVGAVFVPGDALLHMPAFIMGALLTGWAANLVLLAFAAVSVFTGVGLLRLRLYGLRLALAYFAFGIVNAVFSFLLPGSAVKFQRAVDAMPMAFKVPNPPRINLAALSVAMIVVTLIPVFFLLKNRGAFEPLPPTVGAPPSVSP